MMIYIANSSKADYKWRSSVQLPLNFALSFARPVKQRRRRDFQFLHLLCQPDFDVVSSKISTLCLWHKYIISGLRINPKIYILFHRMTFLVDGLNIEASAWCHKAFARRAVDYFSFWSFNNVRWLSVMASTIFTLIYFAAPLAIII